MLGRVVWRPHAARSTPPRRLARIAATQHGVFTRAQAIACGVSARTATRRLSSGMWDRLHPAVYRVAGLPETWRQALMAACLAWGDGVVVSHIAAAAMWGLVGFEPGRIELSAPRMQRRARGLPVHHPMTLARAEGTTLRGIPVTTVARTLI